MLFTCIVDEVFKYQGSVLNEINLVLHRHRCTFHENHVAVMMKVGI
jgi:hypothetical protein